MKTKLISFFVQNEISVEFFQQHHGKTQLKIRTNDYRKYVITDTLLCRSLNSFQRCLNFSTQVGELLEHASIIGEMINAGNNIEHILQQFQRQLGSFTLPS